MGFHAFAGPMIHTRLHEEQKDFPEILNKHSQVVQKNQSLTSATPSAEIWNRASASARHGELITLQIRSSPLPFRRASLYIGVELVIFKKMNIP